MQSAQARDNASRDTLASQLGAGATQPRNATATADESAHDSRRSAVILQASKPTLVQHLWWQRSLDEYGAFLGSEELAGEAIGLGGGMNRARHERFSCTRHSRAQ